MRSYSTRHRVRDVRIEMHIPLPLPPEPVERAPFKEATPPSKLLSISINNGDEMNENVRMICDNNHLSNGIARKPTHDTCHQIQDERRPCATGQIPPPVLRTSRHSLTRVCDYEEWGRWQFMRRIFSRIMLARGRRTKRRRAQRSLSQLAPPFLSHRGKCRGWRGVGGRGLSSFFFLSRGTSRRRHSPKMAGSRRSSDRARARGPVGPRRPRLHHGGSRGPTAAAVLGDNAHRYERRHGSANNNDDGGDDNDDSGGWMMTFEGRDEAVYRGTWSSGTRLINRK